VGLPEGIFLRQAGLNDMDDMQTLFRKELKREPQPFLIRHCVSGFPTQVAELHGTVIGFTYCLLADPGIPNVLRLRSPVVRLRRGPDLRRYGRRPLRNGVEVAVHLLASN
jgi:hypothetical protein